MFRLICVCLFVVAASALPVENEVYGPPQPYSYSYDAESDGAKVSRSESTDGSGLVIGSYTIASEDGLLRIVEYTAGPEGFQANIRTNEPGTKSENSAGVQIEANPIEVPENLARAVPIRPVISSVPAISTVVSQPSPVRYEAPQPENESYDPSKYVLVPLESLRNAQ